MRKSKIHLIIVVWGEHYITPFLTVALPSLLSPGNIPALAERADLHLQIFTTTDDCPRISAAAVTEKARRYAQIGFFEVGKSVDLKQTSTYHAQNAILQCAVGIAGEERADLMFIAPDFVVADGSLLKLYEALDAEHGAVLLPSIRVNKYSFLPELLDTYGWETDHTQSLTATGRELAGMALRHLHPLVRAALVAKDQSGKTYCRAPLFYLPVADDGLWVRSLIWSPHYVRPRIWPDVIKPTIDYTDFPRACGITQEERVAVGDSDDVLMLEFSSYTADFFQTDKANATIDGVMDWIGRLAMPHHINNLRFSYLLHAAEIADSLKAATERAANDLTREIVDRTQTLIDYALAPGLLKPAAADTAATAVTQQRTA